MAVVGRTALALMLAFSEAAMNATLSPDLGDDSDSDEAPPGASKMVSACANACPYAFDGDCDDGGMGAVYQLCVVGEDCGDCGLRAVLAAPPAPPAPPSRAFRHIPLSAFLLLAWCLASFIRGLQTRHLRRYREPASPQNVGTSWDAYPPRERGSVAIAVPVYDGQVVATDAGASGGTAASGEPPRERGGRDEESAPAAGWPVHAAAASSELEGSGAPIVVQGRRIANNPAPLVELL